MHYQWNYLYLLIYSNIATNLFSERQIILNTQDLHASKIDKIISILKLMIKSYVLPMVGLQISEFEIDTDFETFHSRDIRNISHCFDISESALVSFASLLVFDSQPMLRLRPSCELCDRDECVW